MVTPWLKLTNLENKESWKIAAPWLKIPIDFTKVKSKADSFTAIFSDNDPFVPFLENETIIERLLIPKIVVLNKKGHFTDEDEVKELPEVLKHLDFHKPCRYKSSLNNTHKLSRPNLTPGHHWIEEESL